MRINSWEFIIYYYFMKYNKKITWILSLFILILCVGMTFASQDIMDVMFAPAKAHEKLLNLWSTKEQVGDEVFRESQQIGLSENFGKGCFIGSKSIDDFKDQKTKASYVGSDEDFCVKILGGDRKKDLISSETQAPLLVRITKFLLRITMVLAVSMVIYNGILWIVESSKGGDIKDAKNNLIYIFVGILIALSSVALINLVSSLGMSSLDPQAVVQTK